MKKYMLFFLTMVLALSSCKPTPRHWSFEKDCSEVSEIKIVEVDPENYIGLDNYKVLKELDVSLVDELYRDIENLEMERYGTNLKTPHGKSFLIVFDNGEYDLISAVEPKRFRYYHSNRPKDRDRDGKLEATSSWLRCDEEAFQNLLAQYLTKV